MVEAPRGQVQPHFGNLECPADDQLLFKIMRAEDLVRSIEGNYLYFNRVDSYKDFHRADKHDGEQLPLDRAGNAASSFASDPTYTAESYYDEIRRKTYACCFGLENTPELWQECGNNGKHGKVCLVFDFGKLRTRLNALITSTETKLIANGDECVQIFSINYGKVRYVDWKTYRSNNLRLANPIDYTYFKDVNEFKNEQELRISMAAEMGNYVLNTGAPLDFQKGLGLQFSFVAAYEENVIAEVRIDASTDVDFLNDSLEKLRIKINVKR